VDDDDEEDDLPALSKGPSKSAASGDVDLGYERPQGNDKMQALLARRRAEAAEGGEGDD
jgi:hypothetical protein